MAGDWIKMRVDLRTHPKVVRMAGALHADKLRVIGGLFAVWSIFDAHSPDGILEGYTFHAIDDDLGWKGFAQAMSRIGWLGEDEAGLTAPRFDEHNGQSAKRRAMESERKRLEREADKAKTKAGQLSAPNADKKRTREEKRRDNPPTPLPGGSDVPSGKAIPGAPITVPSDADKATAAYLAEQAEHAAKQETPEQRAAHIAQLRATRMALTAAKEAA